MIAKQPVEGAARPYRHPRGAGVIVFYCRGARPFKVVANVDRGRAGHAFDALAIPIIDETGCRRAAHRCQAVLGIVDQAVGAAHDALGHIAVAIIGVAVAPGRRDRVRDGAVPARAGDRSAVGVAHPGFACQVAG